METAKVKYIDLNKMDKLYPQAYIEMYNGVAELGYDDKPTLLANWNHVPSNVMDAIERKLGYMCEWNDEWTSCSGCGKLVRTSPDSYSWTPSYIVDDEWGELFCLECMYADEYYASIENNPRHAVSVSVAWKYPPEEHGYQLVQADFENGYFDGQNADPKEILKNALEHDPEGRFLFVMTDQRQFDIEFALYKRIKEDESNE